MSNDTPMIAQYKAIKAEHNAHLLFYRMGDFYELFFEDAINGAELLNITLTKRGTANGQPIPMAGIPHHSSKTYFQKLVDHNITFAICEQVGEVQKNSKDPVKREVTQIITPGTVLDEDFMQHNQSHALMSIYPAGKKFGVGILNLGKQLIEFDECLDIDELQRIVTLIEPSEIIFPEKSIQLAKTFKNVKIRPDWEYYHQTNYNIICEYFNVSNLNAFACDDQPLVVSAIGAIIQYLAFTRQNMQMVSTIRKITHEDTIKLDRATLKHIVYGQDKKDPSSLFNFINKTATPMGSRLLRTWCGNPTLLYEEIALRQSMVQWFVEEKKSAHLMTLLKSCHDLERCSARIQKQSIQANEIIKLSQTLKIIPNLINQIKDCHAATYVSLQPCNELAANIDHTIFNPLDEQNLNHNYLIKPGVNNTLDQYRQDSEHDTFLNQFEQQEQTRLGNNKIKVGYNRVQGYFIEIPKSQSLEIPQNYIRCQTLKHAERYITKELEDFEKKIITNKNKANELEKIIFQQFVEALLPYIQMLQTNASAIAKLDALVALASVGEQHGWVMPEILNDSIVIDITGGVHPIVDTISEETFIPNNLYLDSQQSLSIITGPNMGGKSTYMRQTAIIAILSYIGSMVPAKRCRIGQIDQIFTRIGASDDITQGQSTFMVEMQETAFILRHATNKSLIIMDEIGRGTSTFDGLSIAYACASQIATRMQSLCLFATHYFELTELADHYSNIQNHHVSANDNQNELILLHQVKPGPANKSYGIAVAKLAGLPPDTLLSAQEKLHQLEQNKRSLRTPQLGSNFIIDQLKDIDIESLSPRDAWDYLIKLKELIAESIV